MRVGVQGRALLSCGLLGEVGGQGRQPHTGRGGTHRVVVELLRVPRECSCIA